LSAYIQKWSIGDWSAGSSTLLASIRTRTAFEAVTTAEIMQSAQRGRVLLLLDGWNELDPAARKKIAP
jgi:hypothetical protein